MSVPTALNYCSWFPSSSAEYSEETQENLSCHLHLVHHLCQDLRFLGGFVGSVMHGNALCEWERSVKGQKGLGKRICA